MNVEPSKKPFPVVAVPAAAAGYRPAGKTWGPSLDFHGRIGPFNDPPYRIPVGSGVGAGTGRPQPCSTQGEG
jgi:hypothetical protein